MGAYVASHELGAFWPVVVVGLPRIILFISAALASGKNGTVRRKAWEYRPTAR